MKIHERDSIKQLNDKHKLNTMSTELDFYDQMIKFIEDLEKNETRYMEVQKNASSEYLAKLKAKRMRVEDMRRETLAHRAVVLAEQLKEK